MNPSAVTFIPLSLPLSLPFWAEMLVAVLLLAGGLITLIGSLGLLRLRDFLQRMHGPAMGNTLGAICILMASLLYFSISRERVLVHEVLIVLFLLMTAPVTGMLLARAALYRRRSEAPMESQTDSRENQP